MGKSTKYDREFKERVVIFGFEPTGYYWFVLGDSYDIIDGPQQILSV